METLLANDNPLRKILLKLILSRRNELNSLPIARGEEFYFEKINSAKESLEWELRRNY